MRTTMCKSGFSLLVITSKLLWEKKVSQQKNYVFYHKNKSPRKNVLIETKKLNLSSWKFLLLKHWFNIGSCSTSKITPEWDKRIKLYFSKADLSGNKKKAVYKGKRNTFISLKLNKIPRKIYLLYKKNYFRLNP